MEVKDAILKRRSISSYIDKKVSLRIIGDIINIARYAPNAGNLQNWNIIVVQDEDRKREIAIACLKQMWIAQASIVLVLANKTTEIKRYYGERGLLYGTQNLAALAQNILLLATDKGLSTCWIGAFDKEAVARIVKAPEDEIPEIVITIGYSRDKPTRTTRYSANEICCHEECGRREINYPHSMVAKPLFKRKKY